MIYVLYHGGGCPDGFGAAWAAWRKLGDDGVQYRPVLYQEPPPAMEPGSTVYLVDFCYTRVALREIAERASTVTVIDHHKTAETEMTRGWYPDEGTLWPPGNLQVKFDMEHSGAVLTWQHFHGIEEPWRTDKPGGLFGHGYAREIFRVQPHVPLLLQYVEDRDLWWWKLPHSREVSAYLTSWPQDFKLWSEIADALSYTEGRLADGTSGEIARVAWRSGTHPFQMQGASILRAKDQIVEAAVKRARWAVLGSHRVPIVNATVHGSETGEALCRAHLDAPFAAYYFDTKDGKRGWGLRSRGGFDVSEVAKLYGGGGHAAAAGFTTSLDFYGDAR